MLFFADETEPARRLPRAGIAVATGRKFRSPDPGAVSRNRNKSVLSNPFRLCEVSGDEWMPISFDGSGLPGGRFRPRRRSVCGAGKLFWPMKQYLSVALTLACIVLVAGLFFVKQGDNARHDNDTASIVDFSNRLDSAQLQIAAGTGALIIMSNTLDTAGRR